jgi:PAS domain S-box-containing protein
MGALTNRSDPPGAAAFRRLAELEAEVARLKAELELVRRMAGQALADDRHRFWLAFNEALRPLDDPKRIVATAAAFIARHLGVARAGYGEADADLTHFTVEAGWRAEDASAAPGRFRLDDFGADLAAALRAGETVAVEDARTDPRTAGAVATFAGTNQLSALAVPLLKGGRVVAGFFLNDPQPRAWAPDEIELAEEVAFRTWSEVQQARAEAALRASERRLRATQEHAGVGIAETDAAGRYLRVNEAFCALTGYTREELLALTSWDLTHPDDVARDRAHFEHQIAGELDTYALEKRFVRKDGSVGWGWLTGSAVRDEAGRFLYAVRLLQDVTERKGAQDALRAGEERLRLATEVTGLGTWDVFPQTGRREWSAGFKAILGLPPDAPADYDAFSRVIHPDERDDVIERYAQAFTEASGGRYDTEFRILRADDGRERWVRTTGRVYFDEQGRPVRAIGTLQDVTERHAAEAALRNSEERYRLLVELSPDAMFVDIDGLIVYANRAALRLLGATGREDVEGRSSLDFVDPAYRDLVAERIRRLKASGGTNPPIEQRWVRLDGEVVHVEVSSASVPWENGRANQVILRDVSDRKRADERQRLLLNELNHRVKNTLATVQSLAMQTLRTTATPDAFRDAFLARLMALSATHNLLTQGAWESASLEDLLRAELAPYGGDVPGRVAARGPAILLYPRVALALGMVFHELATNAAKYGALSRAGGRVAVAWELARDAGPAGRLTVRWTEEGGPPVRAPDRRGFGSRLIEQTVQGELAGTVALDYRAEGLSCLFAFDLPKGPGMMQADDAAGRPR